VALAQDEAVALGPVGVLRVVAQDAAEVQGGGDLDGRQRRRRVARAGGGGAEDDVLADGPGFGLQVREGSGGGHGAVLRGVPLVPSHRRLMTRVEMNITPG